MKLRLIRLYRQLLAFLPSALPFGLAEFEAWAADIIFTYNLPDNDSSRFMLSTMIQHAGPTECDKPKRYFGRSARKAGANQIAAQIMYDLKMKRNAEEAAAKAAAEVIPA